MTIDVADTDTVAVQLLLTAACVIAADSGNMISRWSPAGICMVKRVVPAVASLKATLTALAEVLATNTPYTSRKVLAMAVKTVVSLVDAVMVVVWFTFKSRTDPTVTNLPNLSA